MIEWLFSTEEFFPRFHCSPSGAWNSGLAIWSQTADLMIFLAYVAIPYLLWRSKRLRIVLHLASPAGVLAVWLFAGFIVTCGLTHLCDALAFHLPAYRFFVLAKVVCAALSWMTVCYMRFFEGLFSSRGEERGGVDF